MSTLKDRTGEFLRAHINLLIALSIVSLFMAGFLGILLLDWGYINDTIILDIYLLFWAVLTLVLFRLRDRLFESAGRARRRTGARDGTRYRGSGPSDDIASPLRMGSFDRGDRYEVVAAVGSYRGPRLEVVATPYKVHVRTEIDGKVCKNSVTFDEFVDPNRATAETYWNELTVEVPKDPEMWAVEDGGPKVSLIPVNKGGP